MQGLEQVEIKEREVRMVKQLTKDFPGSWMDKVLDELEAGLRRNKRTLLFGVELTMPGDLHRYTCDCFKILRKHPHSVFTSILKGSLRKSVVQLSKDTDFTVLDEHHVSFGMMLVPVDLANGEWTWNLMAEFQLFKSVDDIAVLRHHFNLMVDTARRMMIEHRTAAEHGVQ